MAANSSGEEKSSGQAEGSPCSDRRHRGPRNRRDRACLFSSVAVGATSTPSSSKRGQQAPDNQVLIGGSPVGSVESIELSDDNLAEVHVEVEQELHEGTTATIRATSLSGVANHYVSISPRAEAPGPGRRRRTGPRLDHAPVDIDQLFNTFPPSAQRRSATSSRATRRSTPARARPPTTPTSLRPGPQPHRRLRQGTERRPAPLRALHRQLQQALDHGRLSRRALFSATPSQHRLHAIATRNVGLDLSLRRLPPVCARRTRLSSTSAPPWTTRSVVETAKPATRNLAPSWPNCARSWRNHPFTRNLRLATRGRARQ